MACIAFKKKKKRKRKTNKIQMLAALVAKCNKWSWWLISIPHKVISCHIFPFSSIPPLQDQRFLSWQINPVLKKKKCKPESADKKRPQRDRSVWGFKLQMKTRNILLSRGDTMSLSEPGEWRGRQRFLQMTVKTREMKRMQARTSRTTMNTEFGVGSSGLKCL